MTDLTDQELADLSPQEARDILWKTGQAWQFLLDDLQKNMVNAYYNSDIGKEIVFVYSRQSGKCLKSSTLVATPTGSRMIKDINIGDIVYGYNIDGTVTPTEVKQVHKQGIKSVVDIFNVETDELLITCTKDHRSLFYVDNIPSILDLNQYDELKNKSNIKIVTLDKTNKLNLLNIKYSCEYETETYDLGIDNGTHLYCLANGIVTHNSYSLFTLAYCLCLANPNFTVTYYAPTLKMAKKITRMTFREVTTTAPKDCLAHFKTQDGEYEFPNGSRIELAGFNSGEVDSSRGGKSHLVIMDECGFMDESDFEYGVSSAIYPKLNSTKGTLIMCSTLPKSAAHPYWHRVMKSRVEGRCIEGTIFDCPRYTKEDIDKFAERTGGYESIDFKREYQNLMITNEDFAVIPEATNERMSTMIADAIPMAAYYDSYVAMDIGFRDYTAILFGYYDFLKGWLVIQDEIIIKGTQVTTARIKDLIAEKERLLWETKKPYIRVADNNNLILINELSQHPYNLPFMATAKDNKEAAINNLRMMVQKDKLKVHSRCVNLLSQLQNSTWNNKRTDFDRDAHGGHSDLLIALVYMLRNVNLNKNPYPDDWIMTHQTFYTNGTSGGYDKPKDEFQKLVLNLFSPFKKK